MTIIFFISISSSTALTDKIEKTFFQFGTLNGKLNERSKMFYDWINESSPNKVLFLGSSAMYRNFNPEFLSKNYNGFNIGSSGMNIKIGEEIIRSFIDSDIDIFVLEINPILWNLERYETRKNWIQDWENPTSKVVFKIAIESKRSKEYLMYLYSIIKYYNPVSNYFPLKATQTTNLSVKGSDCVEGNYLRYKTKYQDYVLNLSKENHNALMKLSKLFNENYNKKILFVINPNIDLDYPTRDLPIEVINFNNYMSIDKQFFIDEVHLNCDGMDLFSKEASKIYEENFSSLETNEKGCT